MFSLLTLIAGFVVSLILYIIYTFFLNPYLSIRFYKKQGAAANFYWGLVSYEQNFSHAQTKGDFYYDNTQHVRQNPNLKMIVENFGHRTLLMVLDPQMIKEMLQKHEVYRKDVYFYGILNRLAQGSTIIAEGADWKKGRKIISSAFNFEFLRDMIPMIVETTQEKLDSWVSEKKLKDVEIIFPLGEITGEITGKLFFGKKFGEYKLNGDSLINCMQKLLTAINVEGFTPSFLFFGSKLSGLNLFPRHRKLNGDIIAFRQCCQTIIEETEKNPEKQNNLLTQLLEKRKQDTNDEGLTNEQIIGEFVGLFAAGTDTTSHLINSALYFLCKYPHVLEKVKQEVNREFTDLKTLDIENINRMDYLTGVLKETLRLGGPIDCLFYRSATKDDEICGVKIKKGTLINTLQTMQYMSDQYFKDPETFMPERWIGDGLSKDGVKTEPYAYLPFSAGPRNCVGQHLAMIEAKIIIGLLIKKFEFSIPEDYKFTLVLRFMYEPLDPIKVNLVPKQASY